MKHKKEIVVKKEHEVSEEVEVYGKDIARKENRRKVVKEEVIMTKMKSSKYHESFFERGTFF